jgi:hypothetical protein
MSTPKCKWTVGFPYTYGIAEVSQIAADEGGVPEELGVAHTEASIKLDSKAHVVGWTVVDARQ